MAFTHSELSAWLSSAGKCSLGHFSGSCAEKGDGHEHHALGLTPRMVKAGSGASCGTWVVIRDRTLLHPDLELEYGRPMGTDIPASEGYTHQRRPRER